MADPNPQDRTIILDTPAGIAAYQALSCYHALRLEIRSSMRHSRGSVVKLIKQRYLPNSTARSKQKVLDEFTVFLKEKGILS